MNIRKAFSLMLAAAAALTMSGCDGMLPLDGDDMMNTDTSSYTTEAVSESTPAALTEENRQETQETEAPAVPAAEEEDTGHIHPLISTDTKCYIRLNEYKELVTAKYQAIELTAAEEEKYPRLAKALRSFFSEVERNNETSFFDMKTDIDGLIAQSEEDDEWDAPDYMLTNNDEYEVYIIRSDSTAFSFKKNNYCYFGGTHPYTSEVMCNFDTETGHELDVEDVVLDLNKLNEILYDRLVNEYDGYIDDPAKHLEQCRKGEYGYNWLLCHDGVLFHFNTYTLGPYASGYQTIYIGFDEYPELFSEKYKAAPENYAVPLKGQTGVYADVDGDGKPEEIRAGGYRSDEVTEWNLYLSINEAMEERTINDCPSAESYLVRSGGKYYIYTFCDVFDGYALYVYDTAGGSIKDLNAGAPLPLGLPLYSTYYNNDPASDYFSTEEKNQKGSFTDPSSALLEERLIGLMACGLKNYRAGADGIPASDDKYYTFSGDYLYEVIDTLYADEVDEDGNIKEKDVYLPLEMILRAVRSDGETYVDYIIEGSGEKLFRVYITPGGDDCAQINGKPYYNVIEYVIAEE